MENDFFVGGGIPSIIMALYHAEKYPNRNTIIIESSDSLGGSSISKKYSNGDIFDQGMRIYYESGIDELDHFISSLLPNDKFHYFENNNKDIAGCIFNRVIQDYSPNIDLRNLDSLNMEKVLGEIFSSNLELKDKSVYTNVEEYLLDKYGELVYKNAFKPILQKLYDTQCSDLAIDSLRNIFGAEDRIILFSEKITRDLMKSEFLRKRFGYPNQLNLPNEYSKRIGRGIYPKKMGMINFVNHLEQELLKRDVKFYFNSVIENVIIDKSEIKKISLKNLNEDKLYNYNVDSIRWGTNLVSLSKILGIKANNKFDIANPTFLLHLKLSSRPNIDTVYYLMNYNLKHSTFRITNYSGYCPESYADGHYRLTIEVWPNAKSINYKKIVNELIDSGIIKDDSTIVFSDFIKLSHGFPLPTVNNNKILEKLRKSISELQIENLISFGQFSEKDTFFLPQILNNAFNLFNKYHSKFN